MTSLWDSIPMQKEGTPSHTFELFFATVSNVYVFYLCEHFVLNLFL